MEADGLLTAGAFNPYYVDIHTFDPVNRVVGWTSDQHGPIAPKAAAFGATCD